MHCEAEAWKIGNLQLSGGALSKVLLDSTKCFAQLNGCHRRSKDVSNTHEKNKSTLGNVFGGNNIVT